MFLNQDEIQTLTGRKRWTAQARWLREHGYHCEINAVGRPVVLRAEVERKLCGIVTESRPHKKAQPRLEILDQVG
ncbi:MAG: DUF4224 domain-containing protein [Candidatus Portnoybacteria bacterium]|nr:DUF4224 domain-containing protein [Candidatus Portnoybacteria bacterium]